MGDDYDVDAAIKGLSQSAAGAFGEAAKALHADKERRLFPRGVETFQFDMSSGSANATLRISGIPPNSTAFVHPMIVYAGAELSSLDVTINGVSKNVILATQWTLFELNDPTSPPASLTPLALPGFPDPDTSPTSNQLWVWIGGTTSDVVTIVAHGPSVTHPNINGVLLNRWNFLDFMTGGAVSGGYSSQPFGHSK